MAHSDSSPFHPPDRGPDGERTPFPRWQRRLAEAEVLVAWTQGDDEHRPEPDSDR